MHAGEIAESARMPPRLSLKRGGIRESTFGKQVVNRHAVSVPRVTRPAAESTGTSFLPGPQSDGRTAATALPLPEWN